MLCVPGRGPHLQDCLSARVQQQYPDARVVHRLDMATSGLWLMARGTESQRRLGTAFAERTVHKRYEAVVAGAPGVHGLQVDGWGLIDLPLAADWPNRPRRIVDRVHGKPSLTRWRVLRPEAAGTTRLELLPLTGRTHQLRVHLSALGLPILGDALYAPPEVAAASPRLLLHAAGLALAHPMDGGHLEWTSAAPF
jgi:tRNA pseudouridine32 synthase/23S rRNA pseudouridine746 synthase